MIPGLVPATVAAEELFTDLPEEASFPEEAAAVARAVPGRRREFLTTRACARAALARLGVPAGPVPVGKRGAPVWPAGVVGSLTHCAGYRAAAVAWSRDVATIGIDAEPDGPLPAGVLPEVARPEEVAALAALPAASVCWDRLLFSAKESVYKAWFPVTRRWLDFAEVVISIDPAAGTFAARLLVPGPLVAGRPLVGLRGRWAASGGLLGTVAVVPAGPLAGAARPPGPAESPDR